MTKLPETVVAYKTTEPFTPETVPKALLAMHRTKIGVWGKIDVLAGGLTVSRFNEDGKPISADLVAAGSHAIVAPKNRTRWRLPKQVSSP
ncbi:MAG: DUF1971 domain-containing protein [Cohaesibacteraceae bacterium]